MPGYTHMQRAQPISLAHHVLAYAEMLERDRERFEQARDRTDVMPLGGGRISHDPADLLADGSARAEVSPDLRK